MTTISPSLLSCDFLNIEEELKCFEGIDNFWFHLDIMDGHFVPNLTFGQPIIKKICQKSNHPLDAHLMVTNPKFHIESMKDYGLHNITFHHEACDNSIDIINFAKKHYKSVGISIKPKTKFSDLDDEVLKNIDLLLVMSVEPGFGGQSFIEETYQKLDEIKQYKNKNNLDFMVQVDGGVSDSNCQKLRDHGVNNLVAGSYVFKMGPNHYQEKVESLRK